MGYRCTSTQLWVCEVMGEVLDESDGIALNSAKVVQVRFLPVLECSWGEFAHTKPPGVPSGGPAQEQSVYFQGHRAKPLTGPILLAPKGRLPGPRPVVPRPESLAAQAAHPGWHSAVAPCPAWVRIVSRNWGPPWACYRVPYCE